MTLIASNPTIAADLTHVKIAFEGALDAEMNIRRAGD